MNKDDIRDCVAILMNTFLHMAAGYFITAGVGWVGLGIGLRNTEVESILTSTLLGSISLIDTICAIMALCSGLIYIAYVKGKMHAEKKQQKIEAEWKSE